MAVITPAMIKELRERTGVGMGKCKEALEEANGDMELAIANLRKAGMATAVKKEGRETKEGMIGIAESRPNHWRLSKSMPKPILLSKMIASKSS